MVKDTCPCYSCAIINSRTQRLTSFSFLFTSLPCIPFQWPSPPIQSLRSTVSPGPPAIPLRPTSTSPSSQSSSPEHSSNSSPSTSRFFNFSSFSSPMLLSTNTAKKAPSSTKRASVPPPARFATEMNSTQPQPQPQSRPRPRSSSHIQIPLFSPTSDHRPLPPLPLANSSSSSNSTQSFTDQSIKVPVGDDIPVSSFPSSPYISNNDRLHPRANSPQPRTSHSPQLKSRQYLEHGVNGSSVQPDPHQHPHQTFLRGDLGNSSISSTVSAGSAYPNYSAQKMQERDQVFSPSSKGHSLQDKPLDKHELGLDLTPTPTELSMNPHLNKLLGRDDNNRNGRQEMSATDSVAAKHRQADSPTLDGTMSRYIPPPQFERGSAPLPNPATASLSSSSSTQHHPLPHPDDSNSSPLQRIQNMTSPTFSTTPSYSSPPSFSTLSSSLSSSDLQPYYPPPPTTSTSTPSTATLTSTLQFSTQGLHPIPPRPRDTLTDTLSTATLTSGKLASSPEPRGQRGRRHSLAAGSLAINTSTPPSIKKGPNTADIDTRTMANTPSGKTGNNSRYLEPETVTKGTARKLLKSIGGTKNQQQQQRQSPNHLAIPQQQSSHHARQQGTPSHMTRSQVQLQQYQQQQQQYQNQGSRSKKDESPSSPNRTASSSSLLNTPQDRTAMTMMQRYLTNPDDPDSEADIATQIMISQAAVDSKGFDILVPEAVDGIKRVIEGCGKQCWRFTAKTCCAHYLCSLHPLPL